MWSKALVAGLIAVLALSACGSSEKDAVTAVFKRLDVAQRQGDAEVACEKVFLVREASGAEEEGESEEEGEGAESPEACRAAFANAQAARSAQVKSLKSTVESVEVTDDDHAVATVRSEVTRTDGSSFSNTYKRDLVRHDGHWRIRISPEG